MKTLRFFVFTSILTILVSLSFGFAQQEEHPPLVVIPEGPADSDRLVRLVYLVPSDREPQPGIDTKLDELIKETQQFYADAMERHGYGKKTFRLEADENGKAIVHHVNGQFDDAHYQINPTGKIDAELQEHFDHYYSGVYLIVVEISSNTFDNGDACGYGGYAGFGGHAYIPASGNCFEHFTHTAHELGHAFGLQHDFRSSAYIMSYGWVRTEVSACAALNLNVHPFFNPDKGITRNQNTRIQLLSSTFDATPPHALRLRFEINDPDGLVQALLLTNTTGDSVTTGFPEIVTCKALRGVSENVELVTTKILNDVWVHGIDTDGNYVEKRFDIDFTALTPESDTVHIPDAGLAAAIRDHFDYPPQKQITSFDIARLPYLDASDRGITDLTGLERAVAIESLYLSSNQIQDLTPILTLSLLRKLFLSRNPITDLTQVSKLTQITELTIAENKISDLTPLANLTQLEVLILSGNQIRDITPLTNLTQLTELFLGNTHHFRLDPSDDQLKPALGYNEIRDITPLAHLTQLRELSLTGNYVLQDLTPLADLTQLQDLSLGYNQIRDITPLKNLINLEYLTLPHNQISDIRPLKRSVQLWNLSLYNNYEIEDITALEDMTKLRYLQLGNSKISDITPLSRLTGLWSLDARNNLIADITPLADMTQLRELNLINNQIGDITPIANMTQLYELALFDNQIRDVRPLTSLVNLNYLYIWGNPIQDREPLLTLKRRNPNVEIIHQKGGDPLPVTLSSFKATRTAEGAVINWTTESELDNAGFNILRSRTKTGAFEKINAKLIQGAGTTGERSTYTWTDTTAKPNKVYYYQIEDVSYAGVHQTLTTTRLRGLVSAKGKMTTQWADFKKDQ